MLFKKKKIYSVVSRAISVLLVHAIFLSTIALAAPEGNANLLSPPSSFWNQKWLSRKGFQVRDCEEKEPNLDIPYLPPDRSILIESGEEYQARLYSCMALVVFDEGIPVGISHLQTPHFDEKHLDEIKSLLVPGNRFLLVRGPVLGASQREYITRLLSYLRDKEISEDHIYCHESKNYKEEPGYNSFIFVSALKDKSIKVDYTKLTNISDFKVFAAEKIVEEKLFWNREFVNVIKQGEKTGVQVVDGRHFVNSTALAVISKIIGDDLYNPIELKEPVSPGARARALSNLIRENIHPFELAMSKTHHDPILKGFELDKLRYNESNKSYELPIYRDGVEKFYLKFSIDEKPESTGAPKGKVSWAMMDNLTTWAIPIEDNNYIYVKLEESPADEKSAGQYPETDPRNPKFFAPVWDKIDPKWRSADHRAKKGACKDWALAARDYLEEWAKEHSGEISYIAVIFAELKISKTNRANHMWIEFVTTDDGIRWIADGTISRSEHFKDLTDGIVIPVGDIPEKFKNIYYYETDNPNYTLAEIKDGKTRIITSKERTAQINAKPAQKSSEAGAKENEPPFMGESRIRALVSGVVKEELLHPGLKVIRDNGVFAKIKEIYHINDVDYWRWRRLEGTYLNRKFCKEHPEEKERARFIAAFKYFDATYREVFNRVIILPKAPRTTLIRHEILHDIIELALESNRDVFRNLTDFMVDYSRENLQFREAYSTIIEYPLGLNRISQSNRGGILKDFICRFFSGELYDPLLPQAIQRHYLYMRDHMPRKAKMLFADLGFIWPYSEIKSASSFAREETQGSSATEDVPEAAAEGGRPEDIQRMLDDAVASLKDIGRRIASHKLNRRKLLEWLVVVAAAPEEALEAGVAAASKKTLADFFDLIKDSIEEFYVFGKKGGAFEELTSEIVRQIEIKAKGEGSPFDRFCLEREIEADIDKIEFFRGRCEDKIKENEEKIPVLEKYLRNDADEAEKEKVKRWLDDLTALHWISYSQKNISVANYEKREEIRKRVYDQIERVDPEVRARAIYAICKKQLEDHPRLIKDVFNPAIVKLRNIIEKLKKLDELESTKRKVEGQAEQGTPKEEPIIPESKQVHTIDLVRRIERLQASKEKKLSFIGLGTNFLYGDKEEGILRHDAINPLVTSIREYCRKKGILLIEGDDDKVAKVVESIKKNYKEARGVVLADERTINNLEQLLIAIGLKDDKNIFLAGINDKNLTPDKLTNNAVFYIRFIEMLNLTIKLLDAKSIDETSIKARHPSLGFNQISKRRITFEPDAEPMPYEILKRIYELQEFA
jgi:hypothetical protein